MQENIIFCVSGNSPENKTFLFHNILMENIKEQKILGVIIDNELSFKSQISELCKRLLRKLQLYLDFLHNSEKKLIFNSIIKSQFSYCPLLWIFCS